MSRNLVSFARASISYFSLKKPKEIKMLDACIGPRVPHQKLQLEVTNITQSIHQSSEHGLVDNRRWVVEGDVLMRGALIHFPPSTVLAT